MILAWRDIEAADAEQQVRNLRRRITSVEEQIESYRQFGEVSKASFALRLSLESLKRRREYLQSELWSVLALREREVVTVTLDGPEFPRHSASFASLAEFLRSSQRLFASVLQAITTGPTERGPIPSYIEQAAQLRLTEIYASSFGMVIELGSQENPRVRTSLERSLAALFALFESSIESEQLLERAGSLGSRTMNHYRRLVADLRGTRTTPSVSWTDTEGHESRWNPTSEKLDVIYGALAGIRTESAETKTEIGILVGASLLKGRFELLTDSGEVIEGRVAAAAFEKLTEAFATRCKITFTQSETLNRLTGAIKRVITLTDIRSTDETNTLGGLAPIIP